MAVELRMPEVKAQEMMQDFAKENGVSLKSGVGNDMSTAFYTRVNPTLIQFWPDGLNGSLILITITAKPNPA